MNQVDFKRRTQLFSLSVIRIIRELGRSLETDVIARQLIRSATSVGANYRAACRAKSDRDFITKLKIVEEEADETLYWLEILMLINPNNKPKLIQVFQEGNEILAMVVASIKTVRGRLGAIVNRQS